MFLLQALDLPPQTGLGQAGEGEMLWRAGERDHAIARFFEQVARDVKGCPYLARCRWLRGALDPGPGRRFGLG